MKLLNENTAEITQDFDPTKFIFSNPDTEDFTFTWNGTSYTFQARTTSRFFIVDANLMEMNEIRKQAALKLAHRMFGKSKKYKELEKKSEGKPVPMFFDPAKEYQPYVDMCLRELPESQTKITTKKRQQPQLKKDPKTGKPVVRVMGETDNGSTSLIEEAEQAE